MTNPLFARSVRYANYAIALLLAGSLALVSWFAWRPLPKRSGSLQAAVSKPVSVSFDTLGVPHIRAATLEDALFVQGYVTAQDRLFQMDLLRRFTAGELAEVFGPAALEADRESRRLRLRRIAEDAYTRLPPADRAAFAAYTRGVNAFIASDLDKLPLEFTLAGYQPRPWSVVDSLLVCLSMFRDLTTTWKDEVVKRSMLAAGNPAKVNYLFPVRSGAEPQPGSNAWAIAGSRTASGKPLLSNDMHLAMSIPGIWYMTHLQAPGLDVAGVALPGAPGIIVGHNQRIAWGITNLGFDVQDLYLEKFDDRTGRYLFRGQVEQAHTEREIIRVKGQQPTEVTTWITRHGPIFYSEGADRMALRWMVAEPGMIQYPVLDIDRAQNWQQFTAALERFPGPGSNFVYADVDGNIGYHAAGKLPIRHGYAGDVPVDGSSGDFEWDGVIPFDQLPSAFNPPSGLIATANQNPFPADYPYPVNGNFAAPYRVRQIRNRISARKGWHAQDLLAVQKDVYDGFREFLARQLVAAYEKRHAHNPGLDPAVAMLKQWNGQMDQDLAAPLPRQPGLSAHSDFDRRKRGAGQGSAVCQPDGYYGGRKTASRAPSRLVRRLRRTASAHTGRRGRRRQADAGQRPPQMEVRAVAASPVEPPGDPPGAGDRAVFRHRSGAPERLEHHGQANHPDARALHADERRPRRLEPLPAQHPDGAIRPGALHALRGRMEAVVLRH